MTKRSKLSCMDHLDIAFDDFLLEEETFPTLLEAKDGLCNYCQNPAVYILLKSVNTNGDSSKDSSLLIQKKFL